MAAVEMVPVPSVSQIESQKEGFERREWEEYRNGILTKWRDRQAEINAVPEDEREEFEDIKTWAWMEEDDNERQRLQQQITENSRRLNEEVRGLKARQQRIGLALSRLSPSSAFQLVALEVGGTGLGLSDRYFDSIEEYRHRFGQFVEEQGGNNFSIRIGHGDDDEDDDALGGGMGDQGKPLDLREMPRYQAPVLSAGEMIAPTLQDLGLLSFLVISCFSYCSLSSPEALKEKWLFHPFFQFFPRNAVPPLCWFSSLAS